MLSFLENLLLFYTEHLIDSNVFLGGDYFLLPKKHAGDVEVLFPAPSSACRSSLNNVYLYI